jgi:tetratricopeptide (TPR) repeat protein
MLLPSASVLTSLLFFFAAYWSVRIGYAEYLAENTTRTGLEAAIRITPAKPSYYSRLAAANPAVAWTAIRKAVDLSPRNSSVWIQYSQIAETRQDFKQAEAGLLEAKRLDNGFAPRWLLSEFYFRRHDIGHFWPAVSAALASSYDDVAPLLRQCYELAPDGDTILQALPQRADVVQQYLDFLVNEAKRLDLALPVAKRLEQYKDSHSTSSLLNFCSRLLERGDGTEASEIWNHLAVKRLIPYPALSPFGSLTNGTFRQPFLEHGFDWNMPAVAGVSVSGDDVGPLRLSFSGDQPEQCEVLTQWLVLEVSRSYRFRISYQTAGLESDTGLGWEVIDSGDGTDLLHGSGKLTASERAEREFAFKTGPQTKLARLVLVYARVLGHVRITGSLTLHRVDLALAQ